MAKHPLVTTDTTGHVIEPKGPVRVNLFDNPVRKAGNVVKRVTGKFKKVMKV